MINSAARILIAIKYAVTLSGVLAVLILAPATARAVDNEPNPGSGGCNYTDADGYNIPIDNGQDVFVDGKIVSCRDGKIVVTTAPARGNIARSPIINRNLPVLAQP
ncbi:hypothetical protein [Mycobacterium sp. E740]|uniref:hypothetical protein n=1 Tax=Mycobacterium sp. E740 TaxID=1834149 RepID=UPI0007FCF495|nr:hypothetical protein [Mycobacterium sp. E740]OBI78595.1 hypothetical protein A5663_20025 [Mycobacterium sp. E740]